MSNAFNTTPILQRKPKFNIIRNDSMENLHYFNRKWFLFFATNCTNSKLASRSTRFMTDVRFSKSVWKLKSKKIQRIRNDVSNDGRHLAVGCHSIVTSRCRTAWKPHDSVRNRHFELPLFSMFTKCSMCRLAKQYENCCCYCAKKVTHSKCQKATVLNCIYNYLFIVVKFFCGT